MQLSDKDKPERGSIEIILNNKIVVSTHNQIVYSARTTKASCLIGGPSADYLNSMKLGYVGFNTPPTVFQNEKSLVNPLYEIPIGYDIEPRPFLQDDVALEAFGSVVTWTGIVPVDLSISFDEAGLFSKNGYMWSRATFGVVQKPIGTTMSIRWTIQF